MFKKITERTSIQTALQSKAAKSASNRMFVKLPLVAGADGVKVESAMKTVPGIRKVSGLTLIEVLVVIALIAILAAMISPSIDRSHPRAYQTMCISNQRQIAIALTIFHDDHAGRYPWQTSTNINGSFELVTNGLASAQYSTLAAYLGKYPQIYICPTDKARQPTTNYSALSNRNISYFLNLDAVTNSPSILTGDRNLECNGKLITPGILIQRTNTILKWVAGFHGAQNKPYGIIAFVDGHVQSIPQNDLLRTLQNQPSPTNRFCFP